MKTSTILQLSLFAIPSRSSSRPIVWIQNKIAAGTILRLEPTQTIMDMKNGSSKTRGPFNNEGIYVGTIMVKHGAGKYIHVESLK
ncbi:17750_t:CDS:2 [Funneliformis geosporum]|uniref:203_t:CDS:1 n=1 Tax=Funneliformis geosporum TaxID=1117311 RepID=A0A9W4WUQ0_9GLOM|nr:17750_t:CDS:2 [Funneliformis geosporum]CAI2180364.1 203_t:CDS:2 [Funneliformis geosporum]